MATDKRRTMGTGIRRTMGTGASDPRHQKKARASLEPMLETIMEEGERLEDCHGPGTLVMLANCISDEVEHLGGRVRRLCELNGVVFLQEEDAEEDAEFLAEATVGVLPFMTRTLNKLKCNERLLARLEELLRG